MKVTITTRNNIVYLDLLHGDHLGDNTHVTVEMMEFLIYCNITHYNLGDDDAKYLKNLIVVQYLDLSHNNIGDKFSNIFGRMTQLLYLDLSSNHFTHLTKSFVCFSSELKYFFLQNNKISLIENGVFYFTRKLSTLYLQGNVLLSRSVDSELFHMLSSLSNLSSDLPRLCCMVPADTQCSPEFTMFVTCSDMIHSRFYVSLAWIIGFLTSAFNVACIFILIVILYVQLCVRSQKGMQPVVVVMSFNIIFADMVVSVGLLSLSVYNLYYQGVFGIYADVWRQSIACYSLELSILVGNKCSLIFSVYLAAASYIQITSFVKKTHSTKKYISTVLLTWISMMLIGTCRLIMWNLHEANNFNYYCLPFQMMKSKSRIVIGIQTGIIIIDILLIASYILIQFLLFQYLHSHAKNTSGVLKSRIDHHKIAIRMSCLITSNILTWTPVLVTQLFIMYGKDIDPSTLLLILLVSLPADLLVNPIILVSPFMLHLRKRKPLPARTEIKQL